MVCGLTQPRKGTRRRNVTICTSEDLASGDPARPPAPDTRNDTGETLVTHRHVARTKRTSSCSNAQSAGEYPVDQRVRLTSVQNATPSPPETPPRRNQGSVPSTRSSAYPAPPHKRIAPTTA